jgi:methionyl-tRNA formyltransferase
LKVLLLTNNPISYSLANWLLSKEEKILVYSGKIDIEKIKTLNQDMVISYNYKYIIPKKILELLPRYKFINLHISFLPWNRGAYPNVWSFVDDTPKGVSIHEIDEGIDTGDILIQKGVEINEDKHTLKTSYELLHKEIQQLFKNNWEMIKCSELQAVPQKGKGSIHFKKDFEKIKHLLEEEGWDIPVSKFKKRVREWKESNESK